MTAPGRADFVYVSVTLVDDGTIDIVIVILYTKGKQVFSRKNGTLWRCVGNRMKIVCMQSGKPRDSRSSWNCRNAECMHAWVDGYF